MAQVLHEIAAVEPHALAQIHAILFLDVLHALRYPAMHEPWYYLRTNMPSDLVGWVETPEHTVLDPQATISQKAQSCAFLFRSIGRAIEVPSQGNPYQALVDFCDRALEGDQRQPYVDDRQRPLAVDAILPPNRVVRAMMRDFIFKPVSRSAPKCKPLETFIRKVDKSVTKSPNFPHDPPNSHIKLPHEVRGYPVAAVAGLLIARRTFLVSKFFSPSYMSKN